MKILSNSSLITTLAIVSWLPHLVSAKPGGKSGGGCKFDINDGFCGQIESDVVSDLCIEAQRFGDKCDDFLGDGSFVPFIFLGPPVSVATCNHRFGAYHLQLYFAGELSSNHGAVCCPACTLDTDALDDEDDCIYVQSNSLLPSQCGSVVNNDGFNGVAVVLNGADIQGGQNEFYCCSYGR